MSLTTTAAVVMVTRRCTMKCRHCSVESHPKLRGEPDRERVLQNVRDLLDSGIRSLQVTGGEPMLREDLVLEVLALARARGASTLMVSNGYWGKTPDRARATFRRLLDGGLRLLTVSYDRYHAEFQGPEPALNIIRAARDCGVTVRLNVVRGRDDSDLDALVAPFRSLPNLQMRFYDLQPVGFAADFGADEFRPPAQGFCSACEQAVVTDDGRMIACNGPAYFEKPGSPLVLGRVGEESVQTLLARHWDDPIVATVRTEGPWRLLDELQQAGFERYQSLSYRGMCELCRTINRDPEAVAFLRERLDDSKARSVRLAINLVKAQQRCGGVLNRSVVNQRAAAEVFFGFLAQAAPETIDQRIIGRADFDWEAQARGLESQGLLHLLLPWLDQPELTRWAPTFFLHRVEAAAMADREAREADARRLDQLQELLAAHGARAWLVGETASRALGNPRTLQEWELCVVEGGPSGLAPALAALPGVRVLDAPPPAWDCLKGRRLEPLPNHSRICVLDAPGRVLETGLVHYRRRFLHSLAAAWDLRWNLLSTPDPLVAAPLIFWAGVRPLVAAFPPLRELGLTAPDTRGRREKVLDRLVRSRMFASGRRPDNAFLPLGLALLVASTPLELARLGRSALAETVAALVARGPSGAWRDLTQGLRRLR